MLSNLKSRPIEGYIADNAGNVLRNTTILIKEETPAAGSILVDTVKSDDDGYFISKPIKSGIYDIYESGIRIYRHIHLPYPGIIPAYAANPDNIPLGVKAFSEFVNDNYLTDINNFRYYIQIEPETIDLAVYGNMFPIWDVSLLTELNGHPFELFKNVHQDLTEYSRLTHTRFDVEYYLQMDIRNPVHKRIRWAGVPGLRFYRQSRIVIPLDYYSIVPNHAISIVDAPEPYDWDSDPSDGSHRIMRITLPVPNDTNQGLFDECDLGDILLIEFKSSSTVNPEKFWGIVVKKDSSDPLVLYIRMWLSSNTSHRAQDISDLTDINGGSGGGDTYGIYRISRFHGFFSGIQNLSQTVGERFCVTENCNAQNGFVKYDSSGNKSVNEELYDYNGA